MAAVAGDISLAALAPKVVPQQASTCSPKIPSSPSLQSPEILGRPSSSWNTKSRCPRAYSRIMTLGIFCVICVAIFAVDFAAFDSSTSDAASLSKSLVFFARGVWHESNVGTELTLLACCVALFFGTRAPQQRAKTAGSATTTTNKLPKGGKLPPPRPSRPLVDVAAGKPAAPPPVTARRSPISMKMTQAIDAAGRAGDAMQAIRLIAEFEQTCGEAPDITCYNLGLRACSKVGFLKEAELLVKRMESHGVGPELCSYNILLDVCSKADRPEDCEKWLQVIKDKGFQPNVVTYATTIYCRARRGEVQAAEAWLEHMLKSGVGADAICYNCVIHACAVKGNVAKAEYWLREMQSKDLECGVATFTAVIDACAKSGDIAAAEGWIEAMMSAGVAPNVVTFSAMIDACGKRGSLLRAEYWHDRMVGAGVKPNAHTFSAVINACKNLASAGGPAAAERWLERCEEAGSCDLVVYCTVMDACGKAGDAERALRIFCRMRSRGLTPHVVACAALARPFAYRGDWINVESIEQMMAADGVKPNEYFLYAQLLSYAVARPRQVQRAEACFRNAVREKIKISDHVVSALLRGVGRNRCSELMNELCAGREVPATRQRAKNTLAR